MATIINTPGQTTDSGSGVGVVVGVILAIVIIALLFVYGLPALRNSGNGGVNVQVPDKINVGVQGTGGNQ